MQGSVLALKLNLDPPLAHHRHVPCAMMWPFVIICHQQQQQLVTAPQQHNNNLQPEKYLTPSGGQAAKCQLDKVSRN